MFFTSTALTPITQEQAVWLSIYYDNCRQAYAPKYQHSFCRTFMSPNILERTFQEGDEYDVIRRNWFPQDDYHKDNGYSHVEELVHIRLPAATALAAACVHVKEVVADYCGS